MNVVWRCAVAAQLTLAVRTTIAQPAPKPDSATGAAVLDSMIRARRLSLRIAGGRLEGPGAAILRANLAGVQFLALGERHGVTEVGVFCAAVTTLVVHDFGFTHVAVENGPLALRQFAEVARGGHAAVARHLRRYPNALEFSGDADVAFYENGLERLHGIDRLWGVDQEFGILHILDLARTRAHTTIGRHLIDSTAGVVRDGESRWFGDGGVHWMGTLSDAAAIRALHAAVGAAGDRAAAELLAPLVESAALYDLNRRAGRGELTGLQANVDREALMKRNFMARYREAQQRGTALPKVLLKMGQAHLGRGQGPFGPFTIGNMVSEFAITNGMHSLHVAVLPHNVQGDSVPSLWQSPALLPLAVALPATESSIIDLRPLRPYARAGRLGVLAPDLRRLIDSYDMLVVVAPGHNAESRLVNGVKKTLTLGALSPLSRG